MSDYDFVNTSKLKSSLNVHIKKKKHTKKLKDDKKIKVKEAAEDVLTKGQNTSSDQIDRRTRAEIKFSETKAKRVGKDMLKKAAKTHKERIMEFNEHLDNLSEHYDIPKVSWTK